jgi:hypothetical protein
MSACLVWRVPDRHYWDTASDGYPPSVIRMIVLPGVRRSGANAAGASASGRTAPTIGLSRPSLSRWARSASRERSASTTKKMARPSLGWTVGTLMVVTSVPRPPSEVLHPPGHYRRYRLRPITTTTGDAGLLNSAFHRAAEGGGVATHAHGSDRPCSAMVRRKQSDTPPVLASGCEELKCDVVGISKRQCRVVGRVHDATVGDAEFVQTDFPCL